MRNRKHVEFAILFMFIAIFILALLFDNGVLPPLKLIKEKYLEGQMNTVLQVQASVTTLGIALISLLSGYTKEMHFGISVSQYIMQIKPLIFTHKNNVFIELSLIISGYLSIVYEAYNTLVACFIISIVLIGIMVSDIFSVFSGAKEVITEIKQYCLDFFKESNRQQKADYIFNALSDDIGYAIETNNNSRLKDSLNLYHDIFLTIRNRNNLVLPSPDIIQWEDAYVNTCKILYKQGNGDISLLAIESTCQILSTNAEAQANIELNLWDKISPDFFNELQNINLSSLDKSSTLYKLHHALYKNLWFEDNNQKNNLTITQYSSNVYYFLKRKSKTENDDFYLIKRRLMDFLIMFSTYSFNDERNKQKVAYKEMGYYTKIMIDNAEDAVLKFAFAEWFGHNTFTLDAAKHNMVILIYLYYLSLKEELATPKQKTYATEIAHNNKSAFQSFILWLQERPSDISSEFVEEISSIIKSWEVYQLGKGKFAMMDYVVQEFFVFNFLAGEYEINRLINLLSMLAKDMEFSYFTRFVGSNKARTQKTYEAFLKMFGLEEVVREKASETMEKFESALISVYKTAETNKVNIIPPINNAEIEKMIETIQNEIAHELNSIISPFKNNMPKNTMKLDWDFSRIIFTERCLDTQSVESIRKDIKSHLIQSLARMIFKNAAVETVRADDKNMLDVFFSLVESSDVNLNTLIGYRSWFHGFARKEDFTVFESKMKKVRDETVNNIVFAIDERLLYVNHVNVEIRVDPLTDKEIIESAEHRDGKYFYTVTNDIKLPYNKEELIEHVSKLRRIIRARITCDYGYSTDSNIGVGIIIEY